ncbi:MAG: hypothetical protein ACI97B_000706 [Verrucomicrobiales bacterium]|jgi:hypothetical protein
MTKTRLTECRCAFFFVLLGMISSARALDNTGFEVPDQGDTGFQYTPPAASWTFSAQAGLSGPNGPWRASTVSPDPLGDQFAYLQAASSFSQALTGLVVNATYDLSFFESYRTEKFPSNDLSVVLNADVPSELTIYLNPVVVNPTWELRHTDAFTATNTAYTLTFRSTHPLGEGDRTTLIDGVVLRPLALPGAPMISTLDPPDDAAMVPVYTNLTATFNEVISRGTGNITLSNVTDGTSVVIPVGDPQISISGANLVIHPVANLLAIKDYAVLIDAGAVVDTSTNAFAGLTDGSWTFTTDVLDAAAPELSIVSPAHGSIEVATSGQLVMTFNERVLKGSGNLFVKRSSDDAIVQTIDIRSVSVTVDDVTATIPLSAALQPRSTYYVEADVGVVTDLTGNPFGGLAGPSNWSFSTRTIIFQPITSDADSGIDPFRTYSHAIDFGNNVAFPVATINGIVFAAGGVGAFILTNGTSQTVGSGTNTIPISHNGNEIADAFLEPGGMRNLAGDFLYNDATAEIELTGLTPGKRYQVRLYHRPWELGGNRLQTIGFSTDGIPGAESSAVFNEDNALEHDVGLDTTGRVNAVTYDYTASTTNLYITIDANGGGTYHLYGLTNEARPDDVAPAIVSLHPPDDATEVPTYTNLVMTFDTLVAAGPGNITITNLTGGGTLAFAATSPQVSITGGVLTIDPSVNLPPLSELAVLIDSNAIANIYGTFLPSIANNGSWTFTTSAADLDAPLVSGLSPSNSAVNVATLSDLTMTFDEPVQRGSGNIRIKRASDDGVVEMLNVSSSAVTINGAEVTIQRASVLDSLTGYYVEVEAAAFEDLSGNDFAGITGNASWAFTTVETGDLAYVPITSDADSGISTNVTYTHKLDFGQGDPGALINGVPFDAYTTAANGSLNFMRTVSSGGLADHPGNENHNVTGALINLLTDMYYNSNNADGGTTTWTLSGLTPGVTYDTRIYVRQWGAGPNRRVTLNFDPDGAGPITDSTGLICEDEATTAGMATGNQAYYISYTFTAVSGADLVITATQQNLNNSWHLYGISNQLTEPSAALAVGPIAYQASPTPSVSFTFSSIPGRTYRIEASYDLGGTWFDLEANYSAQGAETPFVDTIAAGMPRVYYRVSENE